MKIQPYATFLLLLLFNLSAMAQFRWGLKAGVQQASATFFDTQSGATFNSRLGVQGGIVTDVALSRSFAIQPSFMASSKGFKYTASFTGSTGIITPFDVVQRPFYLELAAPVLYRFSYSRQTRFFAGIGPYGAIGVGGKVVQTVLFGPAEYDIKFGPVGANSQFRRFDYGYIVVAGVEAGKLLFTANYTSGLAKVSSASVYTNPIQNRTIGLTLGFLVGGKTSEQVPVYYNK